MTTRTQITGTIRRFVLITLATFVLAGSLTTNVNSSVSASTGAGMGTSATEATRYAGTGARNMLEYQTRILLDVAKYWSAVYPNHQSRVGYNWGWQGYTNCNGGGYVSTPMYCPADDTIFLSRSYGWYVYKNYGDFPLDMVIAHEYAHNIQWEIHGNRQSGGRFKELQADCLAGTWARSAWNRRLINSDDIREAYRFIDLEAGGDPVGHGTAYERKWAFYKGFDTGKPAECHSFARG